MLKFAPLARETPGSSGADLHFVRPIDHHSERNPIALNNLPLCLHKGHFFGLVRPSPTTRPPCC